MARPPFWQHAWDAAGPRLATIRTTLESGARGREAPRLRVGQLDSESLDHELLQLLREPIYKSLDILNVRSICPRTTDPQQSNRIFWSCQTRWRVRFEPELTLLVQVVLYKYSIWDLGASYGAKLQNLHYTTASRSRPFARAPAPKRSQRC